MSIDEARQEIANKLCIPKLDVVLKYRKDGQEHLKDHQIKARSSYPNGIIKYDVKYQSILPDY